MPPAISFVIPFLNEEKSLRELAQRVDAAASSVLTAGETHEIIFVDDGSTDDSARQVAALVAEHPHISLLQLQGNFGKSAALAAGFEAASGEIVFTLDADLQDDPKEIPRFIAKLADGLDVVSGYKRKRHDPITKVLPSRVFNWMVRTLTGIELHDVNCGFKAYRRAVLTNVRLYGELHRFVPVLAKWKRFRVGEIEVEHHARQFGASKFGSGRFFRGLMDLLTVSFLLRYERRPAHFFGALGSLLTLAGVAVNAYLTVVWVLGESIGHRPLLILGVLLMVLGVQFLATGLIAELMVHFGSGQKPYVLRRALGPAATAASAQRPSTSFQGSVAERSPSRIASAVGPAVLEAARTEPTAQVSED
jgi:glycosyltransferase involved in cell wall biosynthesis